MKCWIHPFSCLCWSEVINWESNERWTRRYLIFIFSVVGLDIWFAVKFYWKFALKIQNTRWIVIMNDMKEVKSVYLLGRVSLMRRPTILRRRFKLELNSRENWRVWRISPVWVVFHPPSTNRKWKIQLSILSTKTISGPCWAKKISLQWATWWWWSLTQLWSTWSWW